MKSSAKEDIKDLTHDKLKDRRKFCYSLLIFIIAFLFLIPGFIILRGGSTVLAPVIIVSSYLIMVFALWLKK